MTRSAKGTLDQPGKKVKAKSGLNRSILDVSIGTFITKLEYKALWYGRELIKVNPKNTSRACNCCGYTDPENRKREVFFCKNCGHSAHADINAAKNILARAGASGSQRKAVA